MSIATERTLLREFSDDDLEDALRYASDPRVCEHLGPVHDKASTRSFLIRCADRRAQQPRTELELALCDRASGKVIGGVGLEHLEDRDASAMLGYAMHPNFWGKGMMTEALRALLEHGFGTLQLHRVWAHCAVANTRSIALLERLGFRREGTLVDHQLLGGSWSSSHAYAMLDREWRSHSTSSSA